MASIYLKKKCLYRFFDRFLVQNTFIIGHFEKKSEKNQKKIEKNGLKVHFYDKSRRFLTKTFMCNNDLIFKL